MLTGDFTASFFITIKGMAQRLSFCKIINEEGVILNFFYDGL
jgi:hypothetical protein